MYWLSVMLGLWSYGDDDVSRDRGLRGKEVQTLWQPHRVIHTMCNNAK